MIDVHTHIGRYVRDLEPLTVEKTYRYGEMVGFEVKGCPVPVVHIRPSASTPTNGQDCNKTKTYH